MSNQWDRGRPARTLDVVQLKTLSGFALIAGGTSAVPVVVDRLMVDRYR